MRPSARPWLQALVLCLAASPAWAGESTAWATGGELRQMLAAPVGVSWANAPFERVLGGLGASQRLATLRDRRVDPTQPVELAVAGEPLSTALGRIAAHLRLGYCQFGPVAYFGPPAVAVRLRTLAALRLEDARALPPETARKALVARGWHWDRLSEPRGLVEQLANELEAELVGAERIAHDLWPAADLPPLSWIDRLTLVTAQFDLTFRFDHDGRQVTLVDLPREVLVERTYLGGRDAAAQARRWARALPEARITAAGGQVRVAGRLEDHERLEASLRGQPTQRAAVATGQELYQLSVENKALDRLVAELGQRLGLEFTWQRAAIERAGVPLDRLMSLRVADANLDELLAAVFDGTGLTFRRDGRKVEIGPLPRD